MKPEKHIEKFLRRIDVTGNAERKRLGLEELLESCDKTKKLTTVVSQPTFRRIIMNRTLWKTAAVIVFAATVIGVIGILQNGNQAAYALEQTVAAMRGKRSFHIQTYSLSPTRCHDEFWAEFDENGKVFRIRQLDQWGNWDNPVEVIWENQVKYQFEPDDDEGKPGILLISNKEHHVDEEDLEEFDPEMIMERIYKQIEDGDATIEVSDPIAPDGNIVVKVTENHSRRLKVLNVDPETDLVLRIDTYRPYDPNDEDKKNESYVEGKNRYVHGIEVLEYNQPLDPNVFLPNFPDNTIIIDQTSGDVGLAQGDLSDTDIAQEVVRQGLEAWAADDYDTAGKLFGGAPKEFFIARASEKPIGEIIVEEPEWMPLEPNRPRYGVICSYVIKEKGELTTNRKQYCVTTVAGQPDRWFVTPIKI